MEAPRERGGLHMAERGPAASIGAGVPGLSRDRGEFLIFFFIMNLQEIYFSEFFFPHSTHSWLQIEEEKEVGPSTHRTYTHTHTHTNTMAHSLRSKSKLKSKKTKTSNPDSDYFKAAQERTERLARKLKENLEKQNAAAPAQAKEGDAKEKTDASELVKVNTHGWRKSSAANYKKKKASKKNKSMRF